MLAGLQWSWSSRIWSSICWQNFRFQRCILEIFKATYYTWYCTRFCVSSFTTSNNMFLAASYLWHLTEVHSILCICSALVSRALIENSNLIKWSLLFKAFSGLFALICGNGYIVGINQIYDISIDKYVADI